MPYFDELLKRQPFLAAATFSMADITLFAGWRRTVSELLAVKNRTGQALRCEDIERRGA
jgi:glutathione S-transferase